MPPRYIDSEERAARADEQQRQQVAAVLVGLIPPPVIIEPPAILGPPVGATPAVRAAVRMLTSSSDADHPRPTVPGFRSRVPPPVDIEGLEYRREEELTQPAFHPADERAFQRMLWKETQALDGMKKLKRGNRLGHKHHTASGGVRKHRRG